MKKKLLTLIALGALTFGAAATLSSCGDGGSNANTIVFYSTMGDNLQEVADVAIASFEAKYPGWKIEHSQPGGYDEVRKAIVGDLQAGTQPDLAYCYADHVAAYLNTGKVVDIAKFINSDEKINATINGEEQEVAVGYTEAEIKDFVPGYYNEGYATNFAGYAEAGYAETSILTLPFVKSTEVLYYNASALKELNAEVPTTWDELWAICEAAKKKYPDGTPLGYDSEANWFITVCQQNGWDYTSASEPHYTFNNANTQAWLTDLADKFDKGLYTTQEVYGSYTSNLFTKGAETGTIFSIGSSGGASHQAPKDGLFSWGVAPIPGTATNKAAISQGPNLCMFDTEAENSDEKQKMTFLFVKELLDPNFQASFSMESGYNPSRQSTFDNETYATFIEGDSITAVTAGVAKEMNDRFFTSPAFKGSSTARDQVGAALVYAITGQKDAAKALADAAKKCGA